MPDIQGVILIDVWADTALADFYRIVVQQTSVFDLRCCVNASYNLDLRNLGHEPRANQDRSLHNTFRYHFWNRGIESQTQDFKKIHSSDRLINNIVRYSRSTLSTDAILATPDFLGSDASVVILDTKDFFYHCGAYHNHKITNWLVAGQAWMMCVHFRPMGFLNLAKLVPKGYNFYITPWSIRDHMGQEITAKHFNGSDGLIWEPVENWGWRLAGQE